MTFPACRADKLSRVIVQQQVLITQTGMPIPQPVMSMGIGADAGHGALVQQVCPRSQTLQWHRLLSAVNEGGNT